MNYTKSQKRELYNKLPKKLREIIGSDELYKRVEDISAKNNLTDEQDTFIIQFVTDSLIGIEDKKNLKQKLSAVIIPTEKTGLIENEIVNKIYNDLDNLYLEILKNVKSIEQSNGRDFDIDYYINSDNESMKNLDKNIEQRVFEISTKYDLNKDQTQELINNVSKYINDKDSGITSESIALDIGISKIVAEQVAQDIESRIFNYINKTEKTSTVQTPQIPKQQPVVLSNVPSTNVPVYSPKPKVLLDSEPVQTPVSVPRFKAVPMDDNEIVGSNFIPNLAPKPSTTGIMQAKMDKAPVTTTATKETTNYSVDPYREPLA